MPGPKLYPHFEVFIHFSSEAPGEEAYTLKVKKKKLKKKQTQTDMNFQEIKIPQGPIIPIIFHCPINSPQKKKSVLALCLQPAKRNVFLAGCKHIF